jgi:hypothetical protein
MLGETNDDNAANLANLNLILTAFGVECDWTTHACIFILWK